MYKLILPFVLSMLLMNRGFAQKNTKEMLSQQWVLQGLKIERKYYDKEDLASRSPSMKNILEFSANGKCYIKSPKGKKLQENTWKLMEDQNSLQINSAEDGGEQVYQIMELKSKKLVLNMEDGKVKNIFIYKALK